VPEEERINYSSDEEIANANWNFDYSNKGHDWDSIEVPETLENIENMCGKLEN